MTALDRSAPEAQPQARGPAVRGWTREQMAQLVAEDISDGAYVNLGIGLPELVAQFVPEDREFIFQTENGLLGMGPTPPPGEEDPELINAGKKPVTAIPGAAFFHHADSFTMIRGGHIDVCVLGAMQVSARGDLANWSTGEPGAVPAVGGAMDLVSGVRRILVITEHTTKRLLKNDASPPECDERGREKDTGSGNSSAICATEDELSSRSARSGGQGLVLQQPSTTGEPKILTECTYPLTGKAVVDSIYTNLAVIDVTDRGLVVRRLAPGVSQAEVQAVTGAPLLQPTAEVTR